MAGILISALLGLAFALSVVLYVQHLDRKNSIAMANLQKSVDLVQGIQQDLETEARRNDG